MKIKLKEKGNFEWVGKINKYCKEQMKFTKAFFEMFLKKLIIISILLTSESKLNLKYLFEVIAVVIIEFT